MSSDPFDYYEPNPSESIKLSPARQALVDDIIALYSCQPTHRRIERYTPDCAYCDNVNLLQGRYQVAGHWFALPKIFDASKNEAYQVVQNDRCFMEIKILQTWTFPDKQTPETVNALVLLRLDDASADSDFPQVRQHEYHRKTGMITRCGFPFDSSYEAEQEKLEDVMNSADVQAFKADVPENYYEDEDVPTDESGTDEAP